MFNGNYINIETMIRDIAKYPFVEELTKREASHHLVGALKLMGAVLPLVRTYKDIEVSNYKGELPKDIAYIHGVNNKGTSCSNQGIAMKYSTDIYHSVLHSDEAKENCKNGTTGTSITTQEEADQIYKTTGAVGEIIPPLWYTTDIEDIYEENSYTINGMSIDCSFPSGWVEISYDSIQTDDKGYPMIPDDESFKKAFKYYLLKEYAEPNYYRGMVQRHIWNDIETKYYAYMGQASNSFKMLSPDQYESLANTLMRIIPAQHQPRDGWKSANRPKF